MKPVTMRNGEKITDAVACDRCCADVGERCHNGRGSSYPFGVHDVRAREAEALERAAEASGPMKVIEVVPEALYDAYETAIILGVKARTRKGKQSVVYQTPDSELPCTWIGPNRGLRRYRGADIIAYLEAGPRRPAVDPKREKEATG